MRNQRLAEQYVAQGKVISQAEYDRTFGATQAQVDKVATWLRSRGVTVTVGGPGLRCRAGQGPVSTMQRALRTTLATAQLEGHRGLVPTTAPAVPASLGVSSVVGLNTMALTTPHHVLPAPGRLPRGRRPRWRRRTSRPPRPATAGDKRCATYWGQHINTSVKRYTNQSNILCGYRPQSLPQMYGVTSAKSAGADDRDPRRVQPHQPARTSPTST